jgi:hypothetical protein
LAAKHDIFVFLAPVETIGWLATLRNNGLTGAYSYGQYVGNRYEASDVILQNTSDHPSGIFDSHDATRRKLFPRTPFISAV